MSEPDEIKGSYLNGVEADKAEHAAEIERLRHENAEMRRTFGSHPLFQEKDKEIERLRAALADAIDFIDPDKMPSKPFTSREMAHQLGLRLNQQSTMEK